VVRYGKHAGAPLSKPKVAWLGSYLTSLHGEAEARAGDDGFASHVAEVEAEVEARMAEEALGANEAAGEIDGGDAAEGE